MPRFNSEVKVDRKKLKPTPKKQQQKYLILLSNQNIIIDNEWAAMKKARRSGKAILEMFKISNRVISQETSFEKYLESKNPIRE